MKIAIVDYGIGNIRSILNAIKVATNHELVLVNQPEQLRDYGKLILPGVGAFGKAKRILVESGLADALLMEIRKGKPVLGICLGMQLLADRSFEHGENSGLGVIPGDVVKFAGGDLNSIHMGWNNLVNCKPDPILTDISEGTDFYFVHGYHFQPKDLGAVIAGCDYGVRFPAIIRRENIWGVQFHPEKSQSQGLKVLKNFVEMCIC